jgi:prophage regulatory protein
MSQQIRKLLEVKNTTGLSGSSIYRMASAGKFPKPIKLGERSSGWIASEVDQWLDDRIATSRNGEEQP